MKNFCETEITSKFWIILHAYNRDNLVHFPAEMLLKLQWKITKYFLKLDVWPGLIAIKITWDSCLLWLDKVRTVIYDKHPNKVTKLVFWGKCEQIIGMFSKKLTKFMKNRKQARKPLKALLKWYIKNNKSNARWLLKLPISFFTDQ